MIFPPVILSPATSQQARRRLPALRAKPVLRRQLLNEGMKSGDSHGVGRGFWVSLWKGVPLPSPLPHQAGGVAEHFAVTRHDNTLPPLPLKKKKLNKTKHEARPGFLRDLSHRASPKYMIRNNNNIKKKMDLLKLVSCQYVSGFVTVIVSPMPRSQEK